MRMVYAYKVLKRSVPTYDHVKVRGQGQMSSISPIPTPAFQTESAKLDRTNLRSLTGQQALWMVLSLPPQHRDYRHALPHPHPQLLCVKGI